MLDSKDIDLNEIREGLEMFDVENKGLIDPLELKQTIEEMNLKDKNPLIYKLITSLCTRKDINKKEGITYDEFINYFIEMLSDAESKKGIKNIFNIFSDKDDKIQMHTFYQTGKEIGDEDNYTEIKYLVELSKTGGKELDFNEFYDIMSEKNKSNKKGKYYYYQNYTFQNEHLKENDFNKSFKPTYNNLSNRINQNNRYNNLEKTTDSTEFKRYHRKYRGQKSNEGSNNSNIADDIDKNKIYIQFKK